MKTKHVLFIITGLVAIIAGIFFTMNAVEANTISKLYDEAKEAYENHDYPKSIDLYEEVLNKDPSHKDARLELADAYVATSNYQEAMSTLQAGIYETPEQDKFYISLSDLYLDQEQVDNAYQTLEKGIKYSNDPSLQKAFERLTSNLYIQTERNRVQEGFKREIGLVWEDDTGNRIPLDGKWKIEDPSIGEMIESENEKEGSTFLFSALKSGKTTIEVAWESHTEEMEMEVVDRLLVTMNVSPDEPLPLPVTDSMQIQVTGEDESGEEMAFDPEWSVEKGLFEVTVDGDSPQTATLTAKKAGKETLTIQYEDFKQEFELVVEGDQTFVQASSQGEGTVSISPDQESFEYGEEVKIEAFPEEGWEFVRWVGDLTGSQNLINHTVDGDFEVVAIFEPTSHDLTLSISGEGEIIRDTLATSFDHMETISLRARSKPGWTFEGWEGSHTGTSSSIDLTMDEDKSMRAVFTQTEKTSDSESDSQEDDNRSPEPTTYKLNVNIRGDGSIQQNKSGSQFQEGSIVQLSATPKAGWEFAGWNGDVNSSSPSITVTMNGDQSVGATFERKPAPEPDPEPEPEPEMYTLTLSSIGQGTIRASNKTVQEGLSITIEAVPSEGWAFVKWRGDVSGTHSSTSVTMTRNKQAAAIFEKVEE